MEKCNREPFSLVDEVVEAVAQSVNHLLNYTSTVGGFSLLSSVYYT
jgi:hypothetical protein